MGFGILFVLMLGLLLLGPKQLHTLLGHVARAKAQFEQASRGFKSQLAAELDATDLGEKTDSHELLGDELALLESSVILPEPALVNKALPANADLDPV